MSEPVLVLTYDDGPGESLTPRILEQLERHHARATFFLSGKRAERSPRVVDAVMAAGHELGCHTYDHLNAWKASPWRVWSDVERGYDTLARWVPPHGVFRPPYGKWTPLTRWQLRRRGAPVVRWTHDSRDTTHGELPAPSAVIDGVMRDGGGVVLMHDFDRESDSTYRTVRADFVLEVTEGLLSRARAQGMRTMTVSELIANGGQKMRGPSRR